MADDGNFKFTGFQRWQYMLSSSMITKSSSSSSMKGSKMNIPMSVVLDWDHCYQPKLKKKERNRPL